MYLEAIPQGGKEPGVMYRCPGLLDLVTVGSGPIRQTYKYNTNKLLVVSGNELYRVDTAWSATLVGTLDTASGNVYFCRNDSQAFIVDGTSGYIFTNATNTLTKITDVDFTGVKSNTYQNNVFIAQQSGETFQISASGDGLSWNALDFASAEFSPDDLVRVISSHKELWLFGVSTTEVWFYSGNADFPLEPVQGANIEHGCIAAGSPVVLDNTVFWLGRDQQGVNTVYRANGYTPVRISTHALEDALAGYSDTTDAIGMAYQQRGHLFYVLRFPTGNATWVYDVATGLWHERAYLNPSSGGWESHLANCCASFGGEIVVGSRLDGSLFAWDLDTYDDSSDAQKWLRAWRALPTGQNNLNRTTQHWLQIDGETGTGTQSGQGSDPQVMLRWSDDGGHTWSNEHWIKMGKVGATGTRVIQRRLGQTGKLRDRVYELSGTDPVKIAWTGAELHLSGAVS